MGLERMNALLEYLGNPEKNFRIIHVAGTNGKGSVCNFISEILKKSGYSVSVYTSPHLIRYNERFESRDRLITDEEFCYYSDMVFETLERLEEKGLGIPTQFERLTAIAYLFFKDQNTDFVILEVGLGGRLDSTNTIENPIVSVITEISKDHIKELGSEIESIAREKAGIIKRGVPVITGVTDLKAMKVIAEESKKNDSCLIDASSYLYMVPILKMRGEHQRRNAAVALSTVNILEKKGYIETDREIVRSAIGNTSKPGRYEVLSADPYLIIDAAHNASGVEAFGKTFNSTDSRYLIGKGKLTLITGFMKDKECDKMVDIITEYFSNYDPIIIATEPESDRALGAKELKDKLSLNGFKVYALPNTEKAYEMAKNLGHKVTLCMGSIYLIGDIKYYFEKKGW